MLKNQEFLLHFRDNEDEGHTGTAVVLFQLQVLLQSAAPPLLYTACSSQDGGVVVVLPLEL